LALENFAFAILAVARPFAFPVRDLAQLAFVFAGIFKVTLVNCDVYDISSDIRKFIANDNILV
jgi:hypothetical protein